VLAGILGVALWPLHFANVLELYPGLGHARIMTYGLFGAFLFGFLGTATPIFSGAILGRPCVSKRLFLAHHNRASASASFRRVACRRSIIIADMRIIIS